MMTTHTRSYALLLAWFSTTLLSIALFLNAFTATAYAADVTIKEVDASNFPTVRVAFGIDDPHGKNPALTFTENGEKVTGVSTYRGEMGRYVDNSNAHLMLALDTSLSMGLGTRLSDAVSAAKALIDQANDDDLIGLVTFGGEANIAVNPTKDHDELLTALSELTLSNRTTMYDSIVLAAKALDKADASRRAIVLLSDGTDAGSERTLAQASAAARKAQAPIYAIAIRERESDRPRELIALANQTRGEQKTVAGTAQLDTLFSDLGRRLLQPYWAEYKSLAPNRAEVQLGVSLSGVSPALTKFRARAQQVSSGGGSGASAYTPPAAAVVKAPAFELPAGGVGVLIATLPFAALLFISVFRFLQKRSTPDIIQRIERHTMLAAELDRERAAAKRSLFRRISAPIEAMAERFLGSSSFFTKITARAEQAAIAIKPGELVAMMVIAGLGASLVGLMFANIIIIMVAFMLGAIGPYLWLVFKAVSRRRAFEGQLADVLQGIASSLQAGHSFNQAISAMVKDAPAPTSDEFARVMTEARLGMPIEEALQHMAERMGSDDFDFAVTTVNIQRTVGGSLSDILEMVGDTVRDRQQFRQKVKALVSMGQMSAYVLLAMPIFIALVLTVMSPEYMAPLYTTSTGHLMLAAGAVSMTLGYFTCMKIVNVKV